MSWWPPAVNTAEGTYLKDFNQCPGNPGTWSCVSVEQLEAAASLPRRRVLYSFPGPLLGRTIPVLLPLLPTALLQGFCRLLRGEGGWVFLLPAMMTSLTHKQISSFLTFISRWTATLQVSPHLYCSLSCPFRLWCPHNTRRSFSSQGSKETYTSSEEKIPVLSPKTMTAKFPHLQGGLEREHPCGYNERKLIMEKRLLPAIEIVPDSVGFTPHAEPAPFITFQYERMRLGWAGRPSGTE